MISSSTIARALALLLLLAGPLAAQDPLRLVYLGMADDPYYEPQPFYTGLSLRDRHRPLEGVQLGLRDTRVLARATGLSFELSELMTTPAELARNLQTMGASPPLAVLLDLPPEQMSEALRLSGPDTLFLNIRDAADRWRAEDCAPNLLHIMPSEMMLSDALAQYLRAQNWRDILLVHGATDADAERAAAARRSAAKFGLRIVDERMFELTNDPRRRDHNNIALLTGGARYDVVWLVDDLGDFGRYLPYATYAPRPVVGSEGLVARAWHWTFERYGAPQLNQRFHRLAGREMSSEDWAGWAAVKALAEAAIHSGSAEPSRIKEALRSPELSVDLYKGVRGNFRLWNGQLRQPIVLATSNAVLAVAPISGFAHETETLDTLGQDRKETACSH
ncbi:amino acid ABC transporter substrate-binding protein [Salipiger sp. PrR002]|uniref:amino acid ABC transporter substrate-binding protein n=1 Tax=Salipiger sp. PrR002 TaxID=2706489 RepID=UPI0013B6FBF4|nr:amino acid ABC transporter substrate-binding protein [Salipiger sp. PrR002]NDW01294.1 amino acid ABC transporter substrate-binding protein [Salipiger sp. PrR002]NDW58062.1 amino acid ABC transporter substrate-binding protein [Salipiger sp. PrR004]